jgi:putative endonuclease
VNLDGHFIVDHTYWVYIVARTSGTLYIGVTNNLERRVWEHKTGHFDGFASKYHCDRLVYDERFSDVLTAITREKQLKGWRRSKKIALIEERNHRWADLAEKWGWKMALPGESIKAP